MAELAEAAAWRIGLPAATVTLVRRAALAHDLGRVGVSNAIWEKPGRSGSASGSACGSTRTSPSAPSPSRRRSRPIGLLAGSHHERLDGSGYHRGTRGPALDQAARILAAADCYGAMREARPYRPALDAAAAEAELLREAARAGSTRTAVDAVLAAAGHRVPRRPRELPAGLTERELEVLLALVRGKSNQQIGENLGISAKTVGHHVQHVYAEGRRPQPGRGDALGLRARPRSQRIGRSPDAGGPRPAHTRRVTPTRRRNAMSTTITEHANAATVRRLYDAIDRRRSRRAGRLFSPGVSSDAGHEPARRPLRRAATPSSASSARCRPRPDGTYRAELRDLYANDAQVVAVHHGTGTRDDKMLDADAALVFEVSGGMITSITVHQRSQDEWDEFFG